MTEVTTRTSRSDYLAAAAAAPSGARIPIEVAVSVPDPYLAYRRASRSNRGFYLETTGGQSGWGYFGTDPVEYLTAYAPAAPRTEGESPSLAALAGLLADERLHRGDCEVPYPCGLFGWLSYDVVRELERLPAGTQDVRGLPRLQFGLFDRVAAWREPRPAGESTTLLITAGPRVEADPGEQYERGLASARSLARRATTGGVRERSPRARTAGATFRSDCGRAGYKDRVRQIKQYIRDGDTFQVNISHRLRAPATVDPLTVFGALRRVNPAPYSGLLEFPGIDLISASPELLLDVEGDQLLTEPIAGTRPRGRSAAEDQRLAAELTEDAKERAEHAMLVDLERNDLGKVSSFGSVDVREYRRVDRYSEVMHLVSVVAGRLRDDVSLQGVCQANPLDPARSSPADRLCGAIAAVFPGGTITGAPKPRTMEIIEELETTQRGPYTGSIAAIGFDQRATLNIVIRTLTHVAGEYHLRVGAGIVHDSEPELEYDETLDKARALITAVDEALETQGTLEVATE